MKTELGEQLAEERYKFWDYKLKSSARGDKNVFIDNQAAEAEQAKRNGKVKMPFI